MRQPIVSAIILALGLPVMSYAADQVAPQAPVAAPAPVAPAAPQPPKAPDFSAIDKERAEFMKSKHERMAKIWGATDPNERQKLIDEDRKAMQAHREKMRSLRGIDDFGGDMMPPMMGFEDGREMPPMRGRPNMERPQMPPMMGHGSHHQEVMERLDRIEKTLNDMAGKKAQ
jgi:hypothetical protein